MLFISSYKLYELLSAKFATFAFTYCIQYTVPWSSLNINLENLQKIQNLVFVLRCGSTGFYQGYKEMSSIFADQKRPRNTSPNEGVGGSCILSQWAQLCTSRDMEPK